MDSCFCTFTRKDSSCDVPLKVFLGGGGFLRFCSIPPPPIVLKRDLLGRRRGPKLLQCRGGGVTGEPELFTLAWTPSSSGRGSKVAILISFSFFFLLSLRKQPLEFLRPSRSEKKDEQTCLEKVLCQLEDT